MELGSGTLGMLTGDAPAAGAASGHVGPTVPTDGEGGGRGKDGERAMVWELWLVAGCCVVFYTHDCFLVLQQSFCVDKSSFPPGE